MSALDPTPDVPVFRLVTDTTALAPVDRYRLAVECGCLDDFPTPAPTTASEN